MAARPAKRQKRLVVQSSPEHGSPEKPRPANATSRKEERTRPITTFFSASTQSEPQHQRDDPRSLEVPEEDLIQDDFDDEELSRHHATIQSSTSVSSRASLGKPVSRSVPKAMGRFKTSGHGLEAEAPLTLLPDGSEEAYGRPWAERFAPTSLDELAVHKKKVADVRGWLADVLNGRARKVRSLLSPLRLADDISETARAQGCCWERQDDDRVSAGRIHGHRRARMAQSCWSSSHHGRARVNVGPV